MPYKNLIYETNDRIGIIKINRPEVRNVLNWETWMELEDVLKRLHSEPHLRVGIITGVGDEAFVAGADLRMLKDLLPSTYQNDQCFMPPSSLCKRHWRRIRRSMARFTRPKILRKE